MGPVTHEVKNISCVLIYISQGKKKLSVYVLVNLPGTVITGLSDRHWRYF
jgi:hypothetical protein